MIDEHILKEKQEEEAEAIAVVEGETKQGQSAAFSVEDRSKNPMSAVFGK